MVTCSTFIKYKKTSSAIIGTVVEIEKDSNISSLIKGSRDLVLDCEELRGFFDVCNLASVFFPLKIAIIE
ncbi:hypothetical protein GFS33_13200 [Sulfolobus sp. E11-6]|nr:hypothetical protein GFS33_13200 [Sulfolobus sp. E11-6]